MRRPITQMGQNEGVKPQLQIFPVKPKVSSQGVMAWLEAVGVASQSPLSSKMMRICLATSFLGGCLYFGLNQGLSALERFESPIQWKTIAESASGAVGCCAFVVILRIFPASIALGTWSFFASRMGGDCQSASSN